ncbi:TPA: fimbrial protein [Salmonella enterica subsp. enterica serovar Potsdam]|nr:type 1 fimbrial protein [Salmonella enterica]
MNMNPDLFNAVLLAALLTVSTGSWALRLDGRTTMSGEVLASACTIALSDRFQTVSMGDLTLREFHRGGERPVRDLVIHLDNCLTSGMDKMLRKIDPPVRVRFDGVRGREPWMFRMQGTATGVALMLRDERQEIVYPGEYLPAQYQKAYNQQELKYRIALVPDGGQITAGDYSATLRFNIDYE